MRNILLVALLLNFQLFFAQADAFTTSTSKDGKYSIKHLKTWSVAFQNNGCEMAITVPASKANQIEAEYRLTKEDNLPKDFNLEMLTTRNSLLISKFLVASAEESGSANFNGLTPNWVTYTYEDKMTTIKGRSYFFLINGVAYQLTLTAPENDFKTSAVLFQQVAESLTIK